MYRMHIYPHCKITPKDEAAKLPPFWYKLKLTFLLKQLKTNVSPVVNVELFLPVIIVVILRIKNSF